jgi:DNA-binding response OmpR family regulator
VTCASTGADAFAHIKSGSFDSIILDLNLPDMSGFDLLAQLQKESATELPPVIIYTGRDLSKNEVAELNKVASSIVVKGPMSPERLIDELHLFLHSVDTKLPVEHQKVIRTLHEPATLLKDRKVLLVDDDMRNTFALSASLRKKGLVVVMADNGALALEKLEQEPDIELVIMDIMMPVMDGYEAMKRIRKMPKVSHLPIIALTAKVMPEDKVKALECGANDFMTKPVDVQKLMNLMSFWLVGGAKAVDERSSLFA